MTKTKNLLFNQNKVKIQSKRSFITLYRILQAYSNKTFCRFSLVKHPTAKAIGLPDVGGEFGSCSVSLMDFTEFDLQRIPYSFHASYLIKA
ncbi:hypothetical protein KVK60_00825 [Helicobacter pylori]|nr:hypothetical protein KVK60_00825 [Helicobacter pylori]